MMPLIRPTGASADHLYSFINRSCLMKWETPQAIEMRFGMEITMYVANR
jgi:coenzyme PQQ precursor peptide PqqA